MTGWICATLLHPTSGQPIPEVSQLYDVHLLSLTSDELIVAGIECPEGLAKTHYAQCWRAVLTQLQLGHPCAATQQIR